MYKVSLDQVSAIVLILRKFIYLLDDWGGDHWLLKEDFGPPAQGSNFIDLARLA